MTIDVIARWTQERLPAARADVDELRAQVAEARAARDAAQQALDDTERRLAYAEHMAAALERAATEGRRLLEPDPPAAALAAALPPAPAQDGDDLPFNVVDSADPTGSTGGQPVVGVAVAGHATQNTATDAASVIAALESGSPITTLTDPPPVPGGTGPRHRRDNSDRKSSVTTGPWRALTGRIRGDHDQDGGGQ